MEEIEIWILGEKVFSKRINFLLKRLNSLGLFYSKTIPLFPNNFFSFLSDLPSKKQIQSPKVPLKTGTFSFDKKIFLLAKEDELKKKDKRKILDIKRKNEERFLLGLFAKPTKFDFAFAEESDFVVFYENNNFVSYRELNWLLKRVLERKLIPKIFLPDLSPMEKKLMRLLWVHRFVFLDMDRISNYLHGNKIKKSLRATEVSISKLRKKIECFFSERKAIENVRFIGYKLTEPVINKIFLFQKDPTLFVCEKVKKAIKVKTKGKICGEKIAVSKKEWSKNHKTESATKFLAFKGPERKPFLKSGFIAKSKIKIQVRTPTNPISLQRSR